MVAGSSRWKVPKLELASLWPAVAALLLATVLLSALIPRILEERAARQLGDLVQLLTPTLGGWIGEGPEELQSRVGALAADSSVRITLISGSGEVLADSARTARQLPAMDDHSDRPEVARALATGSGWSIRRSATTGATYAYAARSFTGPDGRLYVLRLAEPLRDRAILRERLGGTMILASALALIVAGVIFLWLARRFFRPLDRLAEGAAALADGHFDHRLEPPEEPRLAALTDAFNRLADRVEEQIARVRAERDHLEAVVRSLSDGVLVTDAAGRAQLANPEFRRLFGLPRLDPAELTGRTPLELTRRRELADLVERTLRTGRGGVGAVELRVPERRTVALASTPLTAPGPDGAPPGVEVRGVVVVARDTTRATRLDEMRRDFVANVSHELKTPLSAIRAYAETLRDGALEDRTAARPFMERILEQSRRLQALLDDLLTLSRLESLEERPPAERVELLPILRRAVETVEAPARSRRVEVRLEAPAGAMPPVRGDRESLERLATNLLDNAVKYNREGGRVVARLSREPGPPEEVVLEVADSGIGIPPDALPRIFERFYRVDKGRTREEGGTGLGLAIVKHVAQSCGGRVEVESDLGVGTRFRVLLPAAGSADVASPER